MISKRTIDALITKMARGGVLVTPGNTTAAAISKNLTIRQENARTNQQDQRATQLRKLLHTQGHTLQQIAQELNGGSYHTRCGQLSFPMSVHQLSELQSQ